MSPLLITAVVLVLPPLLALAGLMVAIWIYGKRRYERRAGAAVVLGARVWGEEVSPVFRERLNHGIHLWRSGLVPRIILTGGRGGPGQLDESDAARRYCLAQGVPPGAILTEAVSKTTFENMVETRRLCREHAIASVLIVSDPIHMARAMAMARGVGLRALPSPTRTSRYLSPGKRLKFLWSEAWALLAYWRLGY
jgi:uncharacterized SAM-binding protein YcdF (DUF218 family)